MVLHRALAAMVAPRVPTVLPFFAVISSISARIGLKSTALVVAQQETDEGACERKRCAGYENGSASTKTNIGARLREHQLIMAVQHGKGPI
jgi:hypothetical protein